LLWLVEKASGDDFAKMLTIPYGRFTIASDRTTADVAQRMAEQTAPRRGGGTPSHTARYIGTIRPDRFRLAPLIRGMNTYAPRILGRIRSTHTGCVIEGRMTLHPVIVLVLLGFLIVPQYRALGETGAVDFVWLGIVFVFHVVMYYAGFLPEARRVESWLREVAGRQSASNAEHLPRGRSARRSS
jgi:hypothetical protein